LPTPKRPTGTLPAFAHVRGDVARIIVYKNGARVLFATKHGRRVDREKRTVARVVKDQSNNSRSRAAFAFGNAEVSWLAMTTLTWHDVPSPETVKSTLEKFRRAWRARWLEPMDGWIMEMQQRGVPHFHVFHALQSKAGEIISGMPCRMFKRKGHLTYIVGGSFENWLVQTWLNCTGEDDDLRAIAFNRGGICELFRTPDAAGRYISKESFKRGQKELPPHYSGGLGRWWWLNKRWMMQPRSLHDAQMKAWPWAVPLARVWDVADIAEVMIPADVLPPPQGTGRNYQLVRRPYVSAAPIADQKLLPLRK